VACTQLLVRILALNGKTEEARRVEVDCTLAIARKGYYESQAKVGAENENHLHIMSVLAASLRDTGHLKEAESMYRRLLEGLKRVKGEEDGDVAIQLNNYALLLRDEGKLDASLISYQEALQISEKLYARSNPKHPKIPHRVNNISMVLMMLSRFDETKSHLQRAWTLKECNHDVTSVRILWVRLAVAMLAKESPAVFIGQLKTLLSARESRVSNEVDDYWNVQSVLEYLCGRLSPEHGQLLAALVNALNAGAHFHLEQQGSAVAGAGSESVPRPENFDLWRNQNPIPLETPWHGDSTRSVQNQAFSE
jgi:tetratricopeptide (TPR) repeat protein